MDNQRNYEEKRKVEKELIRYWVPKGERFRLDQLAERMRRAGYNCTKSDVIRLAVANLSENKLRELLHYERSWSSTGEQPIGRKPAENPVSE